jgi:hypothetical protein
MTPFYFLVLFFLALIAYAGFDSTLRLIAYLDLKYRYQIIKLQMWFMKRRLERQLNLPNKDWNDFIKEMENPNV